MLDQVVDDWLCLVDGDGKADSFKFGCCDFLGIDADDLSIGVDQRTAGVARVDGRIGLDAVHGVAGAGGEIGHIIVEPDTGFECTCGNKGCLETVASATGIVRVAHHLAEKYEGNSSIKAAVDNGEFVTSKDIIVAATEGDKFADSIVDKVSKYLGLATANISNILNPDSVVIGGGVSAAGEFLRSRVEGYFTRYAFPQVRRTTKVKLAELGNDAGIIGAASLAYSIDK